MNLDRQICANETNADCKLLREKWSDMPLPILKPVLFGYRRAYVHPTDG